MDQRRALLPQSKAQEILASAFGISPQPVLSYTQVPQSVGVTRLSLGSYTGLSIPEAITMTFSFFRSDKLVYTNVSCNGRTCLFLPLESPSDLSRQSSRVLRTPLTRVGVPRYRIPRFRVLDPLRPKAHQHFGAQGGNFAPPSLFQYYGATNLIATDNTTVVAYINKQGGTHSQPFPPFPCLAKSFRNSEPPRRAK